MAWSTAVSDLRNALSDNATDKLRYRKRIIQPLDGVNTSFKTFEFRRVTNFTTAVAPLGVYLNGVIVLPVLDDPASGQFVLATAPVDGDDLTATYYAQWFLDSELTTFLNFAAQWCAQGDDYNNVPVGLRPAAMSYGQCQAYEKLAMRYAENISETYMMEDAPQKDRFAVVKTYQDMAKQLCAKAGELKDDYWARQGQALSPRSISLGGAVRDVPPQT